MLFVLVEQPLDPNSINLDSVINLLVIAVIGGLYRLEGAWIGAFAFVIINNEINTYNVTVPAIGGSFYTVIGLIFLVIVLVSPGGLLGIWDPIGNLLTREDAAAGPSGGPVDQPRRRAERKAIRRSGGRRDGWHLYVASRHIRLHTPDTLRRSKGRKTHESSDAARHVSPQSPLVAIAASVTAALASSGSTSRRPRSRSASCPTARGHSVTSTTRTSVGRSRRSRSTQAHEPKNPNNPSAGMVGGSVGGHPLQIVGFGCSDATPDLAIKETRRLMEQLGADILIGPLSGDEAVAVAHYAQAHPAKTFVNGTAGSQDPTLQIAPQNFFRFNGDGAQWNAGAGKIAIEKLQLEEGRDHHGRLQLRLDVGRGHDRGLLRAGGEITKRVFAPLGTTDFSSLVRQLPPPSQVDGYFWVVGGSATVPSLKAFVQAYGKLGPQKIMGNLFFSVTGNFQEIAPQINGAYTGGFGTPGFDYVKGTAQKQCLAITRHWFKQIRPLGPMGVANAYNGFFFNYYKAAWGLVKGLQAVKGNITPSQKPLQAALSKVSLNTAFGKVSLDSNRQAIEAEWSYQIGRQGREDDGLDRPVHPERQPDVQRPVRAELAASWQDAAGLQEGDSVVGRA